MDFLNFWDPFTCLGISVLICPIQGLDEMVSSESSEVLWCLFSYYGHFFKGGDDLDKVAIFYFSKLWLN